MSNLQVLARRCPIMGKALAVQSARYRFASPAVYNGTSAYHTRSDKVNFHTASIYKAQTIDVNIIPKQNGMTLFSLLSMVY